MSWSVVTPEGEDGTTAALVARPAIIELGRIIGTFDQYADAKRAADAVNAASEVIGKLRVVEGFIGTIIRWHEQPGVDLKDEMRRVETAARDALVTLGCQVGKPAVTKSASEFTE